MHVNSSIRQYPHLSHARDEKFSFRIQEKFFIAEAQSRRLAVRSRPRFAKECAKELGKAALPKMMQSQMAVVTPTLDSLSAARRELKKGRRVINSIGERHGLTISASGTYPLATWAGQQVTRLFRFKSRRKELQLVGRRNVSCGLHIRVQIPRHADRIDLMNRAMPFLPLLLALSTSSPFWQNAVSGLKSYRMAALDELPRTGLPAVFAGEQEYQALVDMLVESGAIENETHIKWAIRPTPKQHALDLRIADSCTYVADAVCISALFRCLMRTLSRDSALNAGIRSAHQPIVEENRWRAQRFGIGGTVLNMSTAKLEPIADAMEDMVQLVAEDADALGCRAETEHARRILRRGTSADIQLAIYRNARHKGLARSESVRAVAEWLSQATQMPDDETPIVANTPEQDVTPLSTAA